MVGRPLQEHGDLLRLIDRQSNIACGDLSSMSPGLAERLIEPLLVKHRYPLLWSLDQDWSWEVYDANDQIIRS